MVAALTGAGLPGDQHRYAFSLYRPISAAHKDVLWTMQRLPTITDGQTAWHFPLADSSAARLAAAMLLEDPGKRRDNLESLVQQDPSTALWTLCRAWRRDRVELNRAGEVAGWLSANALDVLSWPDESALGETCSDSPQRIEQWSQLVARSILVSQASARLAQNKDIAEQALLLGLLHEAEQWISGCQTPPATATQVCGLPDVPTWLIQSLKEIKRGHVADSPAGLVRQILHQLTETSMATSPLESAGSSPAATPQPGCCSADRNDAQQQEDQWPQLHQQALKQSRQWKRTIPGVGGMLPPLVTRLARLHQLQTDFDHTLQSEKLAAMKQLAYGASHEINNPLANISTQAQTLLRDEVDPERRRKLAAINGQAFRAHEMIADMMLFARPPQPHFQTTQLLGVVQQAISEMRAEAELQQTSLHYSPHESSKLICCDQNQLTIAIKALLRNSLEALGHGGRIDLAFRPTDPPDGSIHEWVEVEVCDDGPGLSANAQRHLFDPFFSGREAGRGLGLGLSKCWRIVEAHGGRIEVNSDNAPGVTFTIRLPVEFTQ